MTENQESKGKSLISAAKFVAPYAILPVTAFAAREHVAECVNLIYPGVLAKAASFGGKGHDLAKSTASLDDSLISLHISPELKQHIEDALAQARAVADDYSSLSQKLDHISTFSAELSTGLSASINQAIADYTAVLGEKLGIEEQLEAAKSKLADVHDKTVQLTVQRYIDQRKEQLKDKDAELAKLAELPAKNQLNDYLDYLSSVRQTFDFQTDAVVGLDHIITSIDSILKEFEATKDPRVLSKVNEYFGGNSSGVIEGAGGSYGIVEFVQNGIQINEAYISKLTEFSQAVAENNYSQFHDVYFELKDLRHKIRTGDEGKAYTHFQGLENAEAHLQLCDQKIENRFDELSTSEFVLERPSQPTNYGIAVANALFCGTTIAMCLLMLYNGIKKSVYSGLRRG